MYLTYEEYQQMGGTLDETAFNDLEFEAECVINYYTFNRLKKETSWGKEVKLCMMYLIKNIQIGRNALDGSASNDTSAKSIASQSNDGVSISYNVLSQADIVDEAKKQQETTIHRYLNGVVNSLGQLVLYRGLYPNE